MVFNFGLLDMIQYVSVDDGSFQNFMLSIKFQNLDDVLVVSSFENLCTSGDVIWKLVFS